MANPHPIINVKDQFKKGNPGGPGAPRKRPQSEANEERLRLELPEDVRCMLKLWKHATYADAIALQLSRKAIKGDVLAAKELRESVEGRSVQRVEVGTAGSSDCELRVIWEPALVRPLTKKDIEVREQLGLPCRVEQPIDVKPELPASDEEPSES
jgi:hypothetical protein